MPTPPAPEPTPTPPAGSTGVYPAPTPTISPTSADPSPSLLHLFGSSLVKLLSADPDDAPTIITAKPPPETTPDVAGKKLGHFELIEAIGAGGMATVLKARDLELGRIVALKILPPATAKDSEAVARFKLEGRAAARLDHDNVARVYFCGEDQGLYFIAFEFVAGENLRQIIDRRGPLPAGECVRYMRQVAAGLQHAADRGVVHRDIKPSNILITPDGKAKIVDMGLARHAESISINGGVTQSGVTLGTFDYISPEQAMDPRRADVRSDIYSLGCAFYHALTGRPPVPEGTAAKKLYAHQHENPPDPRGINPKVPDALAVVLSKMMAKDPDRRYASPDALGLDLAALAREWDLPDDGLPPPQGVPAALLVGPPRVPLGLVLAGSVAAVAVAIFVGTAGPPAAAPVAPWDAEKVPPKTAAADAALSPVAQPKPGPVAADAREFAAAVRAGAARVQLRRGAVYDISALPDVVAFDGPELVIEPAPVPKTGPPPELRVADGGRAGGLVIRGAKSFTLAGIRVVVTDGPEAAADDPVGIVVENTDRVTLNGVQIRADRQAVGSRLVGLAVSAGPAAILDVKHALFDLGTRGVGVRLTGAVTAAFTQAAFAPHDAAILLRPDPAGGPAAVALRECSFMLDRGAAAVEAEAAAGGRVTAGFCVFAAAGPAPPGTNMPGAAAPDARPVVLRLAADPTARFAGRPGEPNLYYRTDAAAVADRGYSFDELAKQFPLSTPAADAAARTGDAPPWAAVNPRGRLADADAADTAFRLTLDDPKTRAPDKIIAVGAKYVKADGVTLYPPDNWPPTRPKPAVVAVKGQRVVWPAADPADAAGGVYANFLAAYADLRPGETLLLAHTGPVAVPNLPEKTNLRVTIAAYPKFFPELVPAGESNLRDASLFRLTDGDLTFDGVGIVPGTRAAAVAVSGGRAVTFKNCVITLDEKDADPQAVVALTDPMGEMKSRPQDAAAAPAVRFENCLIRGKGRAVWVQAGRAFDAAADNTAAVLDGPFVVVEHAAKDAAPAGAGGLRLSRSTLVLGGPVVELHAPKDPAARVVALSVDADRCLFAPLSRKKARPLVVVADADPVAEARKYLTWRSPGPNTYANYDLTDVFLDLRPADDGPSAASLDPAQWRAFTGDAGPTVRVKFAGVGPAVRPTAVRSADVAAAESPRMTPIDAGATIADLPKTTAER